MVHEEQAFDALGSCDKNVQDCETEPEYLREEVLVCSFFEIWAYIDKEDLISFDQEEYGLWGRESTNGNRTRIKDVFLDQLVDEKI